VIAGGSAKKSQRDADDQTRWQAPPREIKQIR
jgi:hypothetical protein